MATSKFKIVFTGKGCRSNGEETVQFTCSDPLAAVKGYVNEMVNGDGGSRGWVAAKVYPADEKALHEVGHKCCGGKKCATKTEKSKLFGGYSCRGPVTVKSFATPESRWIDSVAFRAPFYLTVNFLHRDPITYQLGYEVFEAFESWVEQGGSAGQFFNANVKGNEQF